MTLDTSGCLETLHFNSYAKASHSLFPDINECEDAVSVCGQYSDCINIIGSHMCSCWSGFNTFNKDSPVSFNNSCQGKCSQLILFSVFTLKIESTELLYLYSLCENCCEL